MPRIPSLISAAAEFALMSGEEAFRIAIRFTGRERKFLALLFEGLGDHQIAGRMGIPEFLIGSLSGSIAEKLALRAFLPAPAGSSEKGLTPISSLRPIRQRRIHRYIRPYTTDRIQ